MSTDNEKRFLILKKRLDALHYVQPLGMDSSALVEKLLNDLIKTTEGFQQMKKQAEDCKLLTIKNESLLAPLKKENTRLIQENNQLHSEILQAREECESKEIKWRSQLRLLENERADWKFLLQQKVTTEKKLQEELLTLKTKNEFQVKSGRSNENSDINKPNDIDIRIIKDEQRKWLERIQEAQQQVLDLKEELRANETTKVLADEKLKHLEFQIENRDKEIIRLKSKIDLGVTNMDRISNDYQLQEQIQKTQRLQTQLDLLTQENNRLNDELRKIPQSIKKDSPQKPDTRLQNKISQLESDLQDSKKTVLQLREKLAQSDQNQIDLKSLVQQLEQECEDLKIRSQKADQVVQAYQSDKLAFNRVVDSMKNSRETTENELESCKQRIKDMNNQLVQWEERGAFLTQQADQYHREREIVLLQSKRLSDEYEKEREINVKLRDQLRKTEREHDQQTSHVRELNAEIERLELIKASLEEQHERLREDHFAFKNDSDMSSVNRQKLEQIVEALRRENQLLQNSQKSTEQLLMQARRDASTLENEASELRHERRSIQDQLANLTQRAARAEAQLELKVQEITRQTQQLSDIQREAAKLRYQQNSQDQVIGETKRETADRVREADLRISQLQQDLTQMRLVKVERDERIKQLEDVLSLQRSENNQLRNELHSKIDLGTLTETQLKRAQERESEVITLTEEIERVRGNERKLILEKEKLIAEVKKNELLIVNGTKQVELMSRQKEDLMRELADLRNDLYKVKSEDHSTKNQSIRLNEKLTSQEQAMQDLRELLQREQQRCSKLTDQLTESVRNETQHKNRIQELEGTVSQLRSLSEGLERTREELLNKLQLTKGDQMNEERVALQTRAEKNAIEEQVRALQLELVQTRQSLEQVDLERDEMQQSLDEKTELCVRLEQRIKLLEDDAARNQSRLLEIQSRGDRGFETVNALEEKFRDSQFKLQKTIKESENLKFTLNARQKEINELRADLQVIARENQQLNSQVSNLQQKQELQQQEKDYLVKQEERAREQVHLIQVERQDLQSIYEEVCQENQRLQVSLQHSQVQQQNLLNRLAQMENEGDQISQTLQVHQRREQEQAQRCMQLQHALNSTGARVEELERQLRDLLQQNEQLVRECNSSKRLQQGFQYNQDDLTRQLASLDSERQFSQEQISALRREIDAREAYLEAERKRANEIENVLMRERELQMRTNQQIDALKSQNEALTIELEKLSIRLNQMQPNQGFGASRMSDFDPGWQRQLDRKEEEIQDLVKEISQLKQQKRDPSIHYPSGDKSISGDSRLDSSAGWDRLKQESENFKKQMNQAAISSQYLKLKMQSLQREYQGELAPSIHKHQ